MRETILQFGAGNFLRAFVDTFVQEMNDAGGDIGKVVVAQSTGSGRAQALNEQGGRFHVVVRGIEHGHAVDQTQTVDSISRALSIAGDWPEIAAAACSPQIHTIVSNTTEAGFALDAADATPPEDIATPPASFPARLLALLRRRFESGAGQVTLLPCELIERNGDRLRDLIRQQADIWDWTDPAFSKYLTESCTWANSLVDRIASGKPADHALLGVDSLLTVTEPYAFWAVEACAGTAWLQHPAIHRVADVQPYALRKVRILNGAHTALVQHVRQMGRDDITLVRQAVADRSIRSWLHGLLFDEIVPTIASRVDDADGYANQTLERFANPYLDHNLTDIALHHDTKIRVRLAPTLVEFREMFGREPERLAKVLNSG